VEGLSALVVAQLQKTTQVEQERDALQAKLAELQPAYNQYRRDSMEFYRRMMKAEATLKEVRGLLKRHWDFKRSDVRGCRELMDETLTYLERTKG
jgi:FKBP-type peptidyl-prolyl cis-trans isomerase (trigger factor)